MCGKCQTLPAREAVGNWADEAWSTWLPALIRGNYWLYDHNERLPQWSDIMYKDSGSGYLKWYFCTSCESQRGPLHERQLAEHENRAALRITKLSGSPSVLLQDLEAFFDVSDIKRRLGSDGQFYLQLKCLATPERRITGEQISCSDCMIVKTMKRRNIFTNFCSVECQFVSKLPRDAAIAFLLMVSPADIRARKSTREEFEVFNPFSDPPNAKRCKYNS